MLWDDLQQKIIGELVFKENVLAVRLKKDKVVVVLEKKIYIYNFKDLGLLGNIETCANPLGLCSISYEAEETVLACPDKEKGRVRVTIYGGDGEEVSNVLEAHNSSLSCLTMNFSGSLLATASEKGTIIRLYNPHSGDLLQELRRGTDKAELYSIAIDVSNRWLGCTSDKGTVHIFSIAQLGLQPPAELEEPAPGDKPKNHKHFFKFFKKINKYFDSEWSFAKF